MDVLRWLRAEWDRVAGFGLVAVGAGLLVLGYRGVAGSPYVAEQLSYIISGGVGGLFLLGCGATLLISADLHDEWRKLDRIEAAIRREADVAGPNGSVPDWLDQPPSAEAPGSPGSGQPRRGAGAAAAALAVAGAVVAVGWNAAAGTGDAGSAIEGLATAVSGLTLAGVVVTGYTMWQTRRVRGRQVGLLTPYALVDAVRSLPVGRPSRVSGELLTAPGLTRFHRSGCRALAGVAGVLPVPADSVGDLRPCGICGTG